MKPQSQRTGAAAVEFALIAPFLFLMLIGMVEFGRSLMIHQSVTAASRAAAREAVLPSATVESTEAIALDHTLQIPDEEVIVSITPNPTQANAGDMITVTVEVPIEAMTQMGEVWFDNGSTISAKSSMRKEGYQ